MRESSFCICLKPEVNQAVPWSYWGPMNTIVDFYVKTSRGMPHNPKQVHGRLASRKWAVSHKPIRQNRKHAKF